MITNKIHDVQDHLCTHCGQLWMGDCRAHQDPHSEDERLNREGSKPLCEGGLGRELTEKEEEVMEAAIDEATGYERLKYVKKEKVDAKK